MNVEPLAIAQLVEAERATKSVDHRRRRTVQAQAAHWRRVERVTTRRLRLTSARRYLATILRRIAKAIEPRPVECTPTLPTS